MSVSPFLSAYATSTSTCSPTSSSSSSSSPPPPDCTSLLRSLWSDLSSDVMSVSTSITSWLTSITSSNTCTTCTSCSTVKQPQRLTIDEWLHWYQHHRATYIRSLPRAPHQRRRGTYLLHDDESDDEDLDNWDEDLLTSQHHHIQQQHRHDEIYEPQTCLCQRTSQNVTCRSTTLMVAACAGMYERASLKHEEFIAPRHLGVAIDDVIIAPVSPSSQSSVSSSSSCDVSPAISIPIPSSPNSARSSSWSSDDDSDVDMTRSSSPEYHMRRCDSASSLSMDEESESECESMTSEYLDVATTTKKVDKSALRRRSSSTQHLSLMSRSASLNRFGPSTSTPSSIIPKVRRLMTPTSPLPSSSSTDDLMQRLWSIHDGHQLSTMQQSLRDTSIAI